MPGIIQNDIEVGVVNAFLQLQDDGFFENINKASSALENFENTAGGSTTALGNLEKAALTTGKWGYDLTRNVTTPVIKGFSAMTNAFESTESAFTGVKKTLNEEELIRQFGSLEKAYSTLDDAIWQMTQETGSSYEAIAGVMEMAGQLNVPIGEAGKSIIDFTKNIIMLNDTTDLVGADAAKDLAQFVNITNTADDEFGNLGATIVDLGNNTATTEAAIVAMAMRLAGAGSSIGLTEQEILAISATLQSVGISAEMGGSAFSKAIKKMATSSTSYDKIIELQNKTGMSLEELNLMAQNNSKGFIELADSIGMGAQDMKALIKTGLQLQGFAEVSSMSMEDFAETMKNEPIQAVQAFIMGLGDTESAGKSTIEMLQEMGFTEVRLSDTLTRMALSYEDFAVNLDRANKAWGEGTALEEEAALRYENLNVQISQLRENWKRLEVDLAELFVPVLRDIVDVLQKLIDMLRGMPDWVQKLVIEGTALLAILGPILIGISNIINAIIKIKEVLGFFKSFGVVSKVKEVATALGTGAGAGIIGALGTIVSFAVAIIGHLGNMFGIFKGIINALREGDIAGIFSGIAKAIYFIINPLQSAGLWFAKLILDALGLGDTVREVCDNIKQWFSNAWENVKTVCSNFIEWFKNSWNDAKEWWSNLWNNVSELWSNLWDNIKETIHNVVQSFKDAWNGVVEWWQGLGDNISNIWHNLWEGVHSFLIGIIDNIHEAINTWFNNTFGENGYVRGIPGIIQDILGTVITIIKGAIDIVVDIVKTLFDFLVGITTGNFDKFKEDLRELWDDIVGWFNDVKYMVEEVLRGIFDFISDIFHNIINAGREFFENAINAIREKINTIKDNVKEQLDNLREMVMNGINGVKDAVDNIINQIRDIVSNFISSAKEAINSVKDFIKNIIDNIKEHLKDAVEGFKNFATGVIDTIKNLLSTAREIGSNLLDSIANFFKEKLKALVEWFKDFPSKFLEIGKDILSALLEGMKAVWNGVESWAREHFGWLFDTIESIKSAFSGITNSVGNAINGSHASGLDYVPFDGYVAQLHKGERVLTKQENETYTHGSSSIGGDIFNFYNTQPDPYEYARQMKRAKKELLYT